MPTKTNMAVGKQGERLVALDGLRGLAALIVVLSHLVGAGANELSAASELGIDAPGLAHWLLHTPLAVVWAGSEAVMVFFVLSGFVLARAVLRDRSAWSSFYLQRGIRLYLPAWASLLIAAVLATAVPAAHLTQGIGFWLSNATPHPTAGEILGNGLLTQAHPPLNAVLWSLRWEILFSAALPILLLLQAPLRRYANVVAGAALAAACLDATTGVYVAPFILGVLLALHQPWLEGLRRRTGGREAATLLTASLVLLTADLWLPGAQRLHGAGAMLVVLGAAGVVIAPMLHESVARPLCSAFAQWLGSRSFSLYLVHLPIILAVANGLRGPSFLALCAVAIPASMLTAEAFHRLVERPSHRLVRGVTHRSRRRSSLRAEPQLA